MLQLTRSGVVPWTGTYCAKNLIAQNKEEKIGGSCCILGEKMRNSYISWVVNPDRRKWLGKHQRRWNNMIDFKKYRVRSSTWFAWLRICISYCLSWFNYTYKFLHIYVTKNNRSQWPRCLRPVSAAARLLGYRIPSGAWMSVCSECLCCQVFASGWSLEQRSHTDCGVSECEHEALIVKRPWPTRAVAPSKRAEIK